MLAEVDVAAFQHNLNLVKQSVAPRVKLLLMLKANAYGHGLSLLASVLDNIDGVGLAAYSAAISIREQGFTAPIVMMQGFVSNEELTLCLKYNLTPVLHNHYQLECLQKLSTVNRINCWLKINTGMNRLGFKPDEFAAVYSKINAISVVNEDDLVVLTHLATADMEDQQKGLAQIKSFDAITQHIRVEKSVCNSAAIFAFPQAHYDWVRPGFVLYGETPFTDRSGIALDLRPVMTVKARIIALQQLKQGDAIGYGATYVCSEPSIIAVINIGYGDGYPRDAAAGTPVLVRGQRCPLVGRVSMDMITVDVTKVATVALHDEVILWGRGLPLKDVATAMGCFDYEMLARITQRIEIRPVNVPQQKTLSA